MALATLAVAAVAAVVLLPPFFTPDLDDPQAQFEVLDRARLTVAVVVGGVFVLAGTYISWRRVSALHQQVAMAERGQITDRFTRAIDQLGAVRANDAPAPEIRAGGVRSLERIAGESPADFGPILDILTAYLRSESPIPSLGSDSPDDWWDRARRTRDRMDVAFAIEAIQRQWPGKRGPVATPLNLVRTFAQGIVLPEKNLREAQLRYSDLSDANLRNADLLLTDLQGAMLRGAVLSGGAPTSWKQAFG